MIRECHPYCLVCTGDTNWQCSVCNYDTYGAVQSGTVCALNCQGGWGIDSSNPLKCLQCIPNCYRCAEIGTNCS